MGLFGKRGAHQWRGVIEEYRHRLPVSSKTPVVTLRYFTQTLSRLSSTQKIFLNGDEFDE